MAKKTYLKAWAEVKRAAAISQPRTCLVSAMATKWKEAGGFDRGHAVNVVPRMSNGGVSRDSWRSASRSWTPRPGQTLAHRRGRGGLGWILCFGTPPRKAKPGSKPAIRPHTGGERQPVVDRCFLFSAVILGRRLISRRLGLMLRPAASRDFERVNVRDEPWPPCSARRVSQTKQWWMSSRP